MSKTKEPRIAVVGGGLGGLAAACTLAARGYNVTLFDKNPWPGGKAAVLEKGGYRFDMGPTILTMPKVLNRIFQEAGRPLKEYLELVKLEPQWRCFYEDGSRLDLTSDRSIMNTNLAEFHPEAAAGYERFLQLSKRLHDISDRHFFWRSIGGISDMFQARESMKPGTLSDVMAMRMGRSMGGTVRSFIKDKRVAQMMDHFTQYVGSSPEASPAVLAGIADMQVSEGIWYPMGGTGAVPAALTRLAEDLGVTMRLGTEIKKILSQGNKVTGVQTADGETIAFEAVVSNSDTVRTHRELLDDPRAARFEGQHNTEPACSGVVLYLGLKKKYDHLAHHNFVFSRDPHVEFDAIYKQGEPPEDPTCYLAATAQTEPATAPEGGEALYVLTHTPYLRKHHDWKTMFPKYRDIILNKLETTGGMPDLRQRIVVEEALTPQDIHDRYRVLNGAIYGLASHGRWLGAFKPGNRSRFLDGLYFAGGSAHPGPGMPMVLMSGWIAADTLDQDGGVERENARQAAPQQDSMQAVTP